MLLIALLLLVMIILGLIFLKPQPSTVYDERQLLLGGKAYGHAFAAVMFLLVWCLLFSSVWQPYISLDFILLTLLAVGHVVNIGYRIINDVYFSFDRTTGPKPLSMLIIHSVFTLLVNAYAIFSYWQERPSLVAFFASDGLGKVFILGLSFLVITLCLFYRQFWLGREARQ